MSSRPQICALVLVLVAAALVLAALSPALGQVQAYEYVRVVGRVQSLAGQRMLVVTDCPLLRAPCYPAIVDVDLRRLSPAEYRGLRGGTHVLVEGFVVHDDGRHRLVATSVTMVQWQAP